MPKTKISEFSATPANNTDIDSINIAEGCAPSGINDAIRELMAQLKDFQTGAVGDSFNGPVGTTTAAAGAFTTLSATGNVTLGDATTDTLNVGNGGIIKDASGNVGIGVTPSAWDTSIMRGFQVGSAASFVGDTGSGYRARIFANAYYSTSAYKYMNSQPALMHLMNGNDGTFEWFNAPTGTAGNSITFTRAMTLDASGSLLVGQTSFNPSVSGCGITYYGTLNSFSATGDYSIFNKLTTTTGKQIEFRSGNTQVGNITSSSTATVYNVTSDYRLKTVIGAVTGQGARIDALEPIEYTWNSNGSRTRGFLAHKFQEVYADSVTGSKDDVDVDGKPVYQSMQASTSEVIADLVAELQSLRKRVAQLESN